MSIAGIAHRGVEAIDDPTRKRREALQVVEQFEALFARTLVQGLRQTADIGGDGGGMFGSGPGADTYAEWFDDHMSAALGKSGQLGISTVLMRDLERWRQIPPAPQTTTGRRGGVDVAG